MVNPALLARVLNNIYTIHTNDDGYIVNDCQPGVEFKQKFQLDSRTSRYKNQLAPRYSTSPTIMGTITKNYIIIILFEKIIMKKECQYYHHLKHHHHQRHHHPVGRSILYAN
jgi:hypothetical protein